MEKYKITKVDADKAGKKFYGEFYLCFHVDRELLKLNKKILNLEARLSKKHPTFSVQDFRDYVLSGGCSNKNVKVYILNLIDAYMLNRRHKDELN
ncbi:hypothetical protein [Gilliamella intestini]|uniref:Uncharacterized protein n=1 Tax=Gilliamella intestini TaxID=1798183 RepID=A0A1C4BYE8_9GAMM|nr:hypothetical protein [Gilliamella intestini]SCC11887.1 hypothetical protein GA0061080_102645 [Gilliamella intestini]